MSIFEQHTFMKGMNYAGLDRDVFNSPESDEAIDHLASTGANWVAVNLYWYQDSRSSTMIQPDAEKTVSDASLIHLIDYIHQKGMKVMLKPMIEARDGTWRSRFFPINWPAWFRHYTQFILHYAELAQRQSVDLLCIGCEYPQYHHDWESYWEPIIEQVRSAYSGPLTYAARHNRRGSYKKVPFWHLLDYIGIDAYFAIAGRHKNSVRRMSKGWRERIIKLEKWHQTAGQGKPVLFTRLGAASVSGGSRKPWLYEQLGEPNWEEQANYYEAFFKAFENRDWLHGVFWWWWDNPSTSDYIAKGEAGKYRFFYTPKGKDAEGILRRYYAGVEEPSI